MSALPQWHFLDEYEEYYENEDSEVDSDLELGEESESGGEGESSGESSGAESEEEEGETEEAVVLEEWECFLKKYYLISFNFFKIEKSRAMIWF